MIFLPNNFTKTFLNNNKTKTIFSIFLGGVRRVRTPLYFVKFKRGAHPAHPPIFSFENLSGLVK